MVQTILLIGHAALPQGMAAKSAFNHLALAVEIEGKYGVIIKVSVTLVTDVSADFVSRVLIGRSLFDGIDNIIDEFKMYYRGAALNAIIAALKDLNRAFLDLNIKQSQITESP